MCTDVLIQVHRMFVIYVNWVHWKESISAMITRLLQIKRSKSVLISLLILIAFLILLAVYIFNLAFRSSNLSTMAQLRPASAVQVSAGSVVSFAVFDNGSLWAWGANGSAQLGDGTSICRHEPVKIMDNVVAVAAGTNTSMAITSDGALWTWGPRLVGITIWDWEFGGVDRNPRRIMNDVVAVSVGINHAMAITSDNTLWGWGHNRRGQLGNGTYEASRVPIRILDDVVAVSAGNWHTMAITSDGVLWGWGWISGSFPLQCTNVEGSCTPIKLMENVKAVSTENAGTFVITTENVLLAWGRNTNGTLGDGTTERRSYPIKIMENVASVSTGRHHTMAITLDGGLWAWGSNGRKGVNGFPSEGLGRLGDGTIEHRLYPVQIFTDVVSVSVGLLHTLAVTSDGAIWAWGDNGLGQLGDGTTIDQHIPNIVKVSGN